MLGQFSNQVRLAVFASALAILPASIGFAQAHKGHHSGQNAGQKKQAKAMPRPVQAAKATHQQSAAPANGQVGSIANSPRPTNTALVSSLQASRTQLAQASHDYNGHRARALQEVDTAIRLLSTQPGQSKSAGSGLAKGATTTGGSGAVNTPGSKTGSATSNASGTNPSTSQPASNAELEQAHQLLQAMESRMDTTGVNQHSYIQAKDSVQGAIREINLALNGL
jgi:hypothetical protein